MHLVVRACVYGIPSTYEWVLSKVHDMSFFRIGSEGEGRGWEWGLLPTIGRTRVASKREREEPEKCWRVMFTLKKWIITCLT